MKNPLRIEWRCLLLVGAIALLTSCIFRKVTVAPVDRAAGTTIHSPVKVHLLDGATAIFDQGVRIAMDSVHGAGREFGVTDRVTAYGTLVHAIPLDSVAAMESFTGSINVPKSVAMTTLAAAGVAATPLLLKAIFGSCPTIYSDSEGVAVLEAEGFSYSISPLLERRDVHRLRAQSDSNGVVSLDVRNEALETHYINQLALLGVAHGPDEFVLPDAMERPLAVRRMTPVMRAVDRAGNDVTASLARDDSIVFQTDRRTITHVRPDDVNDWIDLTVAAPRGADSVALVFRLRNSLLNTVLLYDEMLRPQGAQAVDFEARDLNTIATMVKMGRWYGSRMGLHVSVRRGDTWDTVAYVPDAGPIAWRDVAAVIPVPAGDTLSIRLSFVADEWRIDRVAVAAGLRHPSPQRIEAAAVIDADGAANQPALESARALDQRYLTTTPGQRFTIRFNAGPVPGDSARTFLLATEGYYTEWIRGSWVRQAKTPQAFSASDTTLVETVRHWARVGPAFEAQFARTRIPVRRSP
jgi:hypothetical protein